LHVTRKAWDDPDFDWQQHAACCFAQRGIILIAMQNSAPGWKSCQQTVLFNSAALIDWNIDKHYLQWIAEKGINVVNTHYIEKGDARSLAQCLAESGWNDAILKPVVSGSARHTYRIAGEYARTGMYFC
jgi:hypothetical protein